MENIFLIYSYPYLYVTISLNVHIYITYLYFQNLYIYYLFIFCIFAVLQSGLKIPYQLMLFHSRFLLLIILLYDIIISVLNSEEVANE